jgi:hypothetical protein
VNDKTYASLFDAAFARVKELAATFKAGEARYLSPDYQEAEARKDFIDKFWTALGWDVNHDVQTNPYEQEVKVERTVHASGQRRADYAFYLAPNFRDPRFFVEAKKPAVEVGTKEGYFQLIRYGWNSRTPLAVITDFEQFHILDCRYKPDLATALNCAVAKYHYSDYIDREKFAKIYWIFSREASSGGSLEKRAAELREPRGKTAKRGLYPGSHQSIDESFLKELDEYRIAVAHAFKAGNPRLDSATLTEITQRALDRLVFMRFLEDKGIELRRHVEKFGEKGSAWEEFIAASRRLDGIYNGVVFKQHAILDAPNFRVDTAAFAAVCKSLGHADSPYDFDAIPIHILGSIYERFLGKVIVATDKRVRIEDKPEVRKAGGVYYTPEYIVRYIVENTVGKLIADKSPEKIAEMRFTDIACGSGSFLLGIYDLLLIRHGKYYNALGPKERARCVKRGDCVARDGKLYLSLRKKREILLNNIYGVDLDSQAVEVCQLSLYLKLLKDETPASAHQYLLDFEHTAQMKKLLPDLSKNIVCGNSLIGTDILEGQLFAGDEERKLNPMNFEDAFPEVMKRGGFDAIVGNPPYIRIQTMQETNPAAVKYLADHYVSAVKGNYDIYVVFAERGLSLLNPHGKLGYILPHKFFIAQYGEPLRALLAEGSHVSHIVYFSDQQVFEGATTYTCLLFLDKEGSKQCRYIKVADLDGWQSKGVADEGKIPNRSITKAEWNFAIGKASELYEKLQKMPVTLADIADRIFQGLVTGADPVFVLSAVGKGIYLSEKTGHPHRLEQDLLHPLCKGSVNLRRYQVTKLTKCILFPYKLVEGKAILLSPVEFQKCYPLAWHYLQDNRGALESRERGKWKHDQWYAFGRSQNLSEMEQPKILTPSIASHASFSFDASNYYYFVGSGGGGGGGYGITLKDNQNISYLYLLGLLNSKLLDIYLKSFSSPFSGGYFAYNRQYIERLPIRTINLSDPDDKSCHDQMVIFVEAMQGAKKELAKAKTDKDKTYYENKCASLDRQIDKLVYDLYSLTEKEIAIVEQNG